MVVPTARRARPFLDGGGGQSHSDLRSEGHPRKHRGAHRPGDAPTRQAPSLHHQAADLKQRERVCGRRYSAHCNKHSKGLRSHRPHSQRPVTGRDGF